MWESLTTEAFVSAARSHTFQSTTHKRCFLKATRTLPDAARKEHLRLVESVNLSQALHQSEGPRKGKDSGRNVRSVRTAQ